MTTKTMPFFALPTETLTFIEDNIPKLNLNVAINLDGTVVDAGGLDIITDAASRYLRDPITRLRLILYDAFEYFSYVAQGEPHVNGVYLDIGRRIDTDVSSFLELSSFMSKSDQFRNGEIIIDLSVRKTFDKLTRLLKREMVHGMIGRNIVLEREHFYRNIYYSNVSREFQALGGQLIQNSVANIRFYPLKHDTI